MSEVRKQKVRKLEDSLSAGCRSEAAPSINNHIHAAQEPALRVIDPEIVRLETYLPVYPDF
jgi:hypothetical protein